MNGDRLRLKAFFLYVNAALLAEQGIAQMETTLKDATPEIRACARGMIEYTRQRAVAEAIDLFNGGGIKAEMPNLN